MSTRAAAIGIAAAVAVMPIATADAKAEPELPNTETLSSAAAHEAGLAAYEQGDFVAAAAYFRHAFIEGGAASDLYGWAQAVRSTGDCAMAIELYDKFIALAPAATAQAAAEQNIERCEQQLAEQPAEPAPAPPLVSPEPVSEPPPPKPEPPPDRAPPRRPDPVGVTLLAIGSSATVAGSVVFGVGLGQRAAQARSGGYGRFDRLDTRIDRMHIAGAVVLGLGVTLAIAGLVRLRVRAKAKAQRDRPRGAQALLRLR